MTGRITRYLRNNVVGFVALFIVLGAGAYAAGLPKDSITSKQIKAGAVKRADLGRNAVTSKSVKDGSLLGADFAPGQLPAGAPGPAGRSALSTLQSGETVRGVWAVQGSEGAQRTGITLPIPAPTQIDSRHAAFDTTLTEAPAAAGCTGNVVDPVAAPGYACIYASSASDQDNNSAGYGVDCTCANPQATGDGSRFGFVIVTNAAGAHAVDGSWAYTAP